MAGSNIYDQIINGSFDAVGAPPSYISPPYNAADYASIYASPPPTYQSGMLGRGQPSSVGSPYLTASEQQKLAQQIAASKALQGQTPTAVASASMPPLPRPSPFAGQGQSMPGATLSDLLAYAKSMPDKYAANPAVAATANVGARPVTKVTASMQPQHRGLFDLLFGGFSGGESKPSSGMGLLSLLTQAHSQQAPRQLSYSMPGLTPSQSYNKANQDAIARASANIGGTGGSSSQGSSSSSNNLGGVSSSGRRYDYDNNQWV